MEVNAKLTTPFVTPVIVSHDWSLTGVNGPARFSVVGNTGGSESVPAVKGSVMGAGATNQYGHSITAPFAESVK